MAALRTRTKCKKLVAVMLTDHSIRPQ